MDCHTALGAFKTMHCTQQGVAQAGQRNGRQKSKCTTLSPLALSCATFTSSDTHHSRRRRSLQCKLQHVVGTLLTCSLTLVHHQPSANSKQVATGALALGNQVVSPCYIATLSLHCYTIILLHCHHITATFQQNHIPTPCVNSIH